MIYKFELNKEEEKKYKDWLKKLPKIPEGYFGAAGGGHWFKFRYTGLGIIVEAGRDDVPEMDIDLTDYENW
jgi:hypothetical protein